MGIAETLEAKCEDVLKIAARHGARNLRVFGSVARGEADIYFRLPTRKGYVEKIWDHAGGVLIVEEAGGVVTDIDGKPLEFQHGIGLTSNRGVLVTNGRLHEQVLDAVAATSESETP